MSSLLKSPLLPDPRFRVAVVVCLLTALVLAPERADAGIGDIVSILTGIFSTLRGPIGGALNGIQSANSTIRDLHQQVVWPISLVNQAKGFVSQVTGQYHSVMAQIDSVPTSSATLANPRQLESVLRSRQAIQVNQLQPAFQKLYQPVPVPQNASVMDRNLMDVDDAMALGALKTTVISDQSRNQMLSLADALEREAARAAPGSTPLLTAQAQVTSLESQAFLQKMLATELRQEAARLAHDNALRKRNAENTRNLRMQIHQVLSRP